MAKGKDLSERHKKKEHPKMLFFIKILKQEPD